MLNAWNGWTDRPPPRLEEDKQLVEDKFFQQGKEEEVEDHVEEAPTKIIFVNDSG